MYRIVISFLVFTASLVAAKTPEWMWIDKGGDEPRVFSHEFIVEDFGKFNENISRFAFRVTADFAAVDVKVNGEKIAGIEPYDPVMEFDIADYLIEGVNRIEVAAYPVDGPSAVAATLLVVRPDGETVLLARHAGEWNGEGIEGRGFVQPGRWAFNHLPEIPASAEYNQWKEALDGPGAKSVSPLPDGFVLETIREAKEDEDSWISLAIDPKGRLVIGKEKSGLLRFTLSEDGTKVVKAGHLAEELKECRGLVFKGDTLYANANSSSTLYRLRDTTGDDDFDEIVAIQKTGGGKGHGRNDLALGPDRAVHAIHGDSVEVPDNTTFHPPSEPDDPRPLGYWSSIGRMDDEWHLYNRGLRNPYGLDFNEHGEAFTYDADNEGDVGLPFYRASRINHLVIGANYGYHQRPGNTRSIPVYAPDTVPTTFDVGRGSPTAVKFGYRSNFPEPWRSGLFALDWAYGRIIRIDLVPRGASYYASGDTFLEGRPLNVTDLDFDKSGAMIFVTGGRKTKSALYRISYHGDEPDERRKSAHTRNRAAFSSRQRQSRQSHENLSLNVIDLGTTLRSLGSSDPWIRNAARTCLQKWPVEKWSEHWKENISKYPGNLARLSTLLALVRQGDAEDQAQALTIAVSLPGDNWRRTGKLTFLRLAELALAAETPASVRNNLAERALAWVDTPDAPVTRESIRLLALLDHPETVSQVRELLDLSETQSDRLFLLEMLSTVRSGWTADSRSAYFKDLSVARRTSAGDRFMPPFFDAIEAAALDAAPVKKRETLEALLADSPANGETGEPRPFVQNWMMTDFSDDNFQTATAVDNETGRELFRAGLCHRCHTFGAEGYPVGPDLARVGSRFSPRDLLQSILEPSAVVSGVYRNRTLELDDGTSITGRLLRDDFRESTLHISTNPFAPTQLTKVSKADIESMTESEVSPMPPSLVAGFEKEEILRLLQWLLRGPDSSDN